jgi:hypothetical protein
MQSVASGWSRAGTIEIFEPFQFEALAMATNNTTKTILAIGLAAALGAAGYYGYGMWQRAHPKPAGPVRVSVQPGQVWIEASDTAQSLNSDFMVENQGTTPMGIDSIEVTAYDSHNKPILRRFIDSNGFAPSIETVPGRVVAAGAKILIFNPFHTFRPDIELHHLTYKFRLSIPQEAPDFNTSVTVEPHVYQAKTAMSLPIKA